MAPAATASSTSRATRSSAAGVISGPMIVPGPPGHRRQGLGPGGEPVDEGVVDRPLDEDLAGVHADLPGVEERGEGGGLDRVVQVGVGEHDQRVVAAELEHAALERPPGPLGEDPPGGRASR